MHTKPAALLQEVGRSVITAAMLLVLESELLEKDLWPCWGRERAVSCSSLQLRQHKAAGTWGIKPRDRILSWGHFSSGQFYDLLGVAYLFLAPALLACYSSDNGTINASLNCCKQGKNETPKLYI